ncbi:MAG: hypothetical protein LBK95_13435 [Bifidobacteriaceae bacterium]|jgi:hypothetical protein|nr:hypothetical protein [Bifidobacteriaceae bacterium]
MIVIAVGAALLSVGACTVSPPVSAQTLASDRENLASAVAGLGPLAGVCAASPPAGYSAAGLELLAAHGPDWSSALDALEPSAPVAATCDEAALRRDLARTRALAVRLAGAEDDLVTLAISRAAAADEALTFDSLAGSAPPEVADLANLDPALASDLALAEDQAGFVAEYLAAQVPDAAVQARLVSSAALHRDRAERLVVMGRQADPPQADPRQVAYQLGEPPTDLDSTRARWATVELALASHYVALPMSSGTDLLVTWQLVEAASWGADLPALPFLK